MGKDAEVLRHEICDFLGQNPQLIEDVDAQSVIEWESNTTVGNYVQSMRRSSTWGGAIEISAFVRMTGKAVVVVNLRDGREIRFDPPGPARARNPPLKISWNGFHYEPL